MNVLLTYRGRRVTDADVAFVRTLIAENFSMHRRALSQQLCQAWDWRQPNGVLKDGVCRSLLLQLHRAGHIQLPAPRSHRRTIHGPATRQHVARVIPAVQTCPTWSSDARRFAAPD